MSVLASYIAASFTIPEYIGTSPASLLWLLPLAAAVAVVYKASKLPTITAGKFIKEAIVLFGSIVIFIVVTAVILHLLAVLVTQ